MYATFDWADFWQYDLIDNSTTFSTTNYTECRCANQLGVLGVRWAPSPWASYATLDKKSDLAIVMNRTEGYLAFCCMAECITERREGDMLEGW